MYSVYILSALLTCLGVVSGEISSAPDVRPSTVAAGHRAPERCFRLPLSVPSSCRHVENQPTPRSWFYDPSTASCHAVPVGSCVSPTDGEQANSFRSPEECVRVCLGIAGADDAKSAPGGSTNETLPVANETSAVNEQRQPETTTGSDVIGTGAVKSTTRSTYETESNETDSRVTKGHRGDEDEVSDDKDELEHGTRSQENGNPEQEEIAELEEKTNVDHNDVSREVFEERAEDDSEEHLPMTEPDNDGSHDVDGDNVAEDEESTGKGEERTEQGDGDDTDIDERLKDRPNATSDAAADSAADVQANPKADARSSVGQQIVETVTSDVGSNIERRRDAFVDDDDHKEDIKNDMVSTTVDVKSPETPSERTDVVDEPEAKRASTPLPDAAVAGSDLTGSMAELRGSESVPATPDDDESMSTTVQTTLDGMSAANDDPTDVTMPSTSTSPNVAGDVDVSRQKLDVTTSRAHEEKSASSADPRGTPQGTSDGTVPRTTVPALTSNVDIYVGNNTDDVSGDAMRVRCRLPLVVGYCFAGIRRWYYDVAKEKCLSFSYSGCGGNANNFNSAEDCRRECAGADAADIDRSIDAQPPTDQPRIEPKPGNPLRTITIMLPVRYNEALPETPSTSGPKSVRDFIAQLRRKISDHSSADVQPGWTPRDLRRVGDRMDTDRGQPGRFEFGSPNSGQPSRAQELEAGQMENMYRSVPIIHHQQQQLQQQQQQQQQQPQHPHPQNNQQKPAVPKFWAPPPIAQLNQLHQQQQLMSSPSDVRSGRQRATSPSSSSSPWQPALALNEWQRQMLPVALQRFIQQQQQQQQQQQPSPWLTSPPRPVNNYKQPQQLPPQQQQLQQVASPSTNHHMPHYNPGQGTLLRNEVMMTAVAYGLLTPDQDRRQSAPTGSRYNIDDDDVIRTARPFDRAQAAARPSNRYNRIPIVFRYDSSSDDDDSSDEDGEIVVRRYRERRPADWSRRTRVEGWNGGSSKRPRPDDPSSRLRPSDAATKHRSRDGSRRRPARPSDDDDSSDVDDRRRFRTPVAPHSDSRLQSPRRRVSQVVPPRDGKMAMLHIVVSRQHGITQHGDSVVDRNGNLFPVPVAVPPFGVVIDPMMPPAMNEQPKKARLSNGKNSTSPERTENQPRARQTVDREEDDENTQVIVEDDNVDDPTQPNYACLLPVAVGDCKSYQVRKNKWYFNRWSGRCEMFFYGGCGGNANRFESLEHCIRTCLEPQMRNMSPQQQQQQQQQQPEHPSKSKMTKSDKDSTHQGTVQEQTTSTPDDVIFVTSPVYVPMTRDDLEAAHLAVGQQTDSADSTPVLVPSPEVASDRPTTQTEDSRPSVVTGKVHGDVVVTSLPTEHVSRKEHETSTERTAFFVGFSKPYIAIVCVLGVVGIAVVLLIVLITVHLCRRARNSKKADIVEDVVKTHMYGDLSHAIYTETPAKAMDEKL